MFEHCHSGGYQSGPQSFQITGVHNHPSKLNSILNRQPNHKSSTNSSPFNILNFSTSNEPLTSTQPHQNSILTLIHLRHPTPHSKTHAVCDSTQMVRRFKLCQSCIITNQNMSCIIDDLIFYRQKGSSDSTPPPPPASGSLDEFCKNFPNTHSAILLNCDLNNHQTLNKLQLKNHEYSVRLSVQNQLQWVRVEATLLHAHHFRRISSKYQQIMLIRELSKHLNQTKSEIPYCIVKGCLTMVHKMYFFHIDPFHLKKATQFYNSMFTRNFQRFEDFISQNNLITTPTHPDAANLVHQELLLSQSLSTSLINFDVSEEKSKYQQVEEAIKRHQHQIRRVIGDIKQASSLEQPANFLYVRVPTKLAAKWMQNNLQSKFQHNFDPFAKILGYGRYLGDKKIDDFTLNMVKLTIKNTVERPFGEGGSCQIFLAKAELTFINSVDNTSYFNNNEKKEKVIAIKKLRPEYQKKLKSKIDHQNNIVSKLKGGVCFFIPKYYKLEQKLDRGDMLLMQYIQGDELDFFMAQRHHTMSLSTKLCILLNVVHGMRYISSYGITHNDLKPINIIVCRNGYLIPKIIDFGQAHHEQVCDQNFSPGHTFPYVAPEVFIKYSRGCGQDEFRFSEKQDVFGFGVILFEVVFNQKLFHFTNAKYQEIYTKKEILERVMLAYERLEEYGDYLAISTLLHLIIRCLDPVPQRRPSFDWIGITLHIILNSQSTNL